MLNRRIFIENSFKFGLATAFAPISSLSSCSGFVSSVAQILGFILPIAATEAVNQGVQKLFRSFDDKTISDERIINNAIQASIVNIYGDVTYNNSPNYRNYYEERIRPLVGSYRLNGAGYFGYDPAIAEIISGHRVKAISPLHCIANKSDFDKSNWQNSCGIADYQLVENGGVFVTPRDARPRRYQGTFYVRPAAAYLLYNPTYYCYGLPIENPEEIIIDEQLQRKIWNKLGQYTSVRKIYKQRFFYFGSDCDGYANDTIEPVYEGTDNVLKEYYNIKLAPACGDCTSPGRPYSPRRG